MFCNEELQFYMCEKGLDKVCVTSDKLPLMSLGNWERSTCALWVM